MRSNGEDERGVVDEIAKGAGDEGEPWVCGEW